MTIVSIPDAKKALELPPTVSAAAKTPSPLKSIQICVVLPIDEVVLMVTI
jgi:hypothetical protein